MRPARRARPPPRRARPRAAYGGYLAARPRQLENLAVARVIAAARATGGHAHIVHLSSADALPMIAAARRDGVRVTAETCPHYLTLAAEEITGTTAKCSPPVREAANRELLWAGLRENVLDMVVSDHSPCTEAMKAAGDWDRAWGGISSLQLGLPLTWTQARRRGVGLPQVAAWMSAAPARLAGLTAKGRIGPRGEIVDGWETRRRRTPGYDWALIRLGAPGVVTEVDVDTSFFTGNFPAQVSLEACGYEGYPSPDELTGWESIVPRQDLAADTRNRFPVTDPRRFTHVRLAAYPDGGIARLRVLGQPVPDPRGLEDLTIDLASQQYGGTIVAASDDFYTSAVHLIRPGRARTMGEGWETRRRRDDGHDHVMIRLAFPGVIQRIIVDTAHFKYNASAEVALSAEDGEPLLARTRLQPDSRHEFASRHDQPVTAVRLDAYPDGGLSRVRLIGRLTPSARRAAGYRWFNSLPASHAGQCLVQAGLDPDRAAELAARRPLAADRVAARDLALLTMLDGRQHIPAR
jgi:allantoicase